MTLRHHRRWPATLAIALVPAIALVACGDDDEESTAATSPPAAETTAAPATTGGGSAGAAGGDQQAFCNALVSISEATIAGPPNEGATPEQLAAEGKALAATIQPFAATLQTNVPAALKADLDVQMSALDTVAATGDTSAFSTPEFLAADASIHAQSIDACGWNRQDVELMDYHFMGIPSTLPPGVTTFELTNAGKEFHEMVLLRKNDGVTETFEQLVQLPPEEALQKASIVGMGFLPQGAPGYVLADLTPGEYVSICFIPVGTIDPSAEPAGEAPPHFTQGMIHPFTVG